MIKSVDYIARSALVRDREWLEDLLSGLLINGVAKDDISVIYPHGAGCDYRLKVLVKGEEKYRLPVLTYRTS